MSTITDKIVSAGIELGEQIAGNVGNWRAQEQTMRDLIAAALEEARREGAEQMRASVESALDDLPLPDGFFVSDIMGAINDTLPLPTVERQAVLLTDEQLAAAMPWRDFADLIEEFSRHQLIAACRSAHDAALAANGLEVRCG